MQPGLKKYVSIVASGAILSWIVQNETMLGTIKRWCATIAAMTTIHPVRAQNEKSRVRVYPRLDNGYADDDVVRWYVLRHVLCVRGKRTSQLRLSEFDAWDLCDGML